MFWMCCQVFLNHQVIKYENSFTIKIATYGYCVCISPTSRSKKRPDLLVQAWIFSPPRTKSILRHSALQLRSALALGETVRVIFTGGRRLRISSHVHPFGYLLAHEEYFAQFR